MLGDGPAFKLSKAPSGGSLCAAENSTLVLNRTAIMGSHATQYSGGGIDVRDGSTFRLFQSVVSGCHARFHGGGMAGWDYARLELHGVRFINNVAGAPSATGYETDSDGGGLLATESTTITMQGVTFLNNSASQDAGGLAVSGDATLVLLGAVTLTNNTALRAGGGLRLWSGLFNPDELTRFVRAEHNTADMGADRSFTLFTMEILDSSDTDAFIPSDSPEGMFRLTLNMAGPHGMPTDNPIVYTVRDAKNATIYSTTASPVANSQGTKELSISMKYPPGEIIHDERPFVRTPGVIHFPAVSGKTTCSYPRTVFLTMTRCTHPLTVSCVGMVLHCVRPAPS